MDTARSLPHLLPAGVLRAAPGPKGTLTHAAASLLEKASLALGSSERDASQRASRFEQANYDWNPLSAADVVGTQLFHKVHGDSDYRPDALKGAAVTLATPGPRTLLMLKGGAEAALARSPLAQKAVGALASSKAAKAIAGALSRVDPLPADDGIIEGALVSKRLGASTAPMRPVYTRDGAIPQPAPAPQGALSTPDGTMADLLHYSHTPDLETLDPARMGSNPRKNMSRDELRAKPRTYFGENVGQDGGYRSGADAGIGPYAYKAQLPERKIVTAGSDLHKGFVAQAEAIQDDPALKKAWGLPTRPSTSQVVDTLIQNAGFSGRRFMPEHTPFGQMVTSFEELPASRVRQPLAGAPTRIKGMGFVGPYDPAHDAAEAYTQGAGIDYQPSSDYLRVDPERARHIADAYQAMPHAPNDPEVRKAYGALASETIDQLQAAKQAGMRFEFYPEDGSDPYGSPWNAIRDVRDNKHMYVYPTDSGYGSGSAITDQDIAENPLLGIVHGETWNGRPVRINDAFRAVHDYFGHAKDGVGFRADGEENAWRSHLGMFSPEAQRAMTTETRGQNSWLNYGPHGEANRTASTGDTRFADQKIGLMPDWTLDPTGMPSSTPPPKPALLQGARR